MKKPTFVFLDLTGSSALYEQLGEAGAAARVSAVVGWAARLCEGNGGQAPKFLGDGLLVQFPDAATAVQTVVKVQQTYEREFSTIKRKLKLSLQIGLAAGEVVEMVSDRYGTVLNLAARLSDMAGADAIWASETVFDCLTPGAVPAGPIGVLRIPGTRHEIRYRRLGAVAIHGLSMPQHVVEILWHSLAPEIGATVAADLKDLDDAQGGEGGGQPTLVLSYLDRTETFTADRGPITIGRAKDNNFPVDDPRVSRRHLQIECTDGVFHMTDTSTYGSHVRFIQSPDNMVLLRRSSCPLTGDAEIALSAPFSDLTTPIVECRLLAALENRSGKLV